MRPEDARCRGVSLVHKSPGQQYISVENLALKAKRRSRSAALHRGEQNHCGLFGLGMESRSPTTSMAKLHARSVSPTQMSIMATRVASREQSCLQDASANAFTYKSIVGLCISVRYHSWILTSPGPRLKRPRCSSHYLLTAGSCKQLSAARQAEPHDPPRIKRRRLYYKYNCLR